MNRSFVNSELGLFSYEILGLVGDGGAGPHDLLQMARHGRLLDWAGESQYYAEPKRLARLGYLDARKADECIAMGRRNCSPIEVPQR